MNEYNITAAQYVQNDDGQNKVVKATIDGTEWHIPMNTANRHYQAILDWVADGNTIQDADQCLVNQLYQNVALPVRV